MTHSKRWPLSMPFHRCKGSAVVPGVVLIACSATTVTMQRQFVKVCVPATSFRGLPGATPSMAAD